MLAAPWFLAVVGFVINMICTVVMLNSAVSKLPKPDFTPAPDPVEVAAAEVKAAEAAAPPPQLWSFKTNAVDELITELKKEREAIIEEQKDLAAMSSQVTAERQEVEKVKEEIMRLRKDFEARIVEVAQHETENLKNLAQTYTAMLPAGAAVILREIDEDAAVKILSQMKPKSAALVLGEMARIVDKNSDEPPARRAARISDKLRLMKAPKKDIAAQ
jgi:flagellar motility protein MotE (MotC chaperone)